MATNIPHGRTCHAHLYACSPRPRYPHAPPHASTSWKGNRRNSSDGHTGRQHLLNLLEHRTAVLAVRHGPRVDTGDVGPRLPHVAVHLRPHGDLQGLVEVTL